MCAWVCICATHLSRCTQWSEMGLRAPGTRIPSHCYFPSVYSEWNSGFLKEQVLFTFEPSLKPQEYYIILDILIILTTLSQLLPDQPPISYPLNTVSTKTSATSVRKKRRLSLIHTALNYWVIYFHCCILHVLGVHP